MQVIDNAKLLSRNVETSQLLQQILLKLAGA